MPMVHTIYKKLYNTWEWVNKFKKELVLGFQVRWGDCCQLVDREENNFINLPHTTLGNLCFKKKCFKHLKLYLVHF